MSLVYKEIANYYSQIEKLKTLNSALSDEKFFLERGYTSLKHIPLDLLNLSFPVFSPIPFLQKSFNKIIDVGCGAGLDMFLINKYFTNSFVVGIDISMPLLKMNKSFSLNDVVLAEGTILPFKEATFDCAILNGSFNVIEDKEALVTALTNALKPRSFIFVADIFKKREIEIPEGGELFNLKGALTLKELFILFRSKGFSYDRGSFDAFYTKDFGLFGILWRRGER